MGTPQILIRFQAERARRLDDNVPVVQEHLDGCGGDSGFREGTGRKSVGRGMSEHSPSMARNWG